MAEHLLFGKCLIQHQLNHLILLLWSLLLLLLLLVRLQVVSFFCEITKKPLHTHKRAHRFSVHRWRLEYLQTCGYFASVVVVDCLFTYFETHRIITNMFTWHAHCIENWIELHSDRFITLVFVFFQFIESIESFEFFAAILLSTAGTQKMH